ncbi:MAG: glutathione peroxidase [Burkholderiales bacterium]|nr:glutathione peroxidase [Burkholderiales bacterium]
MPTLVSGVPAMPLPAPRRARVAPVIPPLAAPLLALLLGMLPPLPALAAGACPPLLRHTMPRLQDEKPIDLCSYAGQVLLVVNTASFCGYTSQYKGLEALHARYRGRGLVILGFPTNDFGQQEPGSNREIADFCENTFGVKFPMFAKTTVRPGAGANPLFVALAQRSGQAPKWNFHKYLIGRQGEPVISHGSAVDPNDPNFIRDLERLIESK